MLTQSENHHRSMRSDLIWGSAVLLLWMNAVPGYALSNTAPFSIQSVIDINGRPFKPLELGILGIFSGVQIIQHGDL
jgi:hypothetical protein